MLIGIPEPAVAASIASPNGAIPNDTSPPKLTIEIIKAIIYIIIFCFVKALLKNIPISSFFNLTSL